MTTASKAPQVKFSPSEGFLADIKRRVDDYFRTTGRSPRDCPLMYFKTATILAAAIAIYLALVFFVTSWWLAIPLAVALGLSMAAIGLNIQHDGSHRAYSDRAWVNRMMAFTLDLVGGSSYLWDVKHNSLHHTYTNIAGEDTDIDVGILGRLAPEHPHLPFHRFQHYYLWFLYGFLTIKWQLYDDFHDVIVGRIGQHPIPRPKGVHLVAFLAGKAIFYSLIFVVPALFHPFWAVLVAYGLAAFVCGVTLAIIFQLAHCVETTEFPLPNSSGRMAHDWAVHQVQTTADFARNNRVLSYLLGGLNFQVEHHLLSRICHVHYPAISKLIEQACADHGLRYNAHRTFFAALASHFRWLKRMGLPEKLNC